MAWIGRKKIAFIPVFRPNARPPDVIPADWNSDILRRVFYDPDRGIGPDRSLRAYIHAASSGVANFDAVVMPMATIDLQDVRLEFLDPLLDGPVEPPPGAEINTPDQRSPAEPTVTVR